MTFACSIKETVGYRPDFVFKCSQILLSANKTSAPDRGGEIHGRHQQKQGKSLLASWYTNKLSEGSSLRALASDNSFGISFITIDPIYGV